MPPDRKAASSVLKPNTKYLTPPSVWLITETQVHQTSSITKVFVIHQWKRLATLPAGRCITQSRVCALPNLY